MWVLLLEHVYLPRNYDALLATVERRIESQYVRVYRMSLELLNSQGIELPGGSYVLRMDGPVLSDGERWFSSHGHTYMFRSAAGASASQRISFAWSVSLLGLLCSDKEHNDRRERIVVNK